MDPQQPTSDSSPEKSSQSNPNNQNSSPQNQPSVSYTMVSPPKPIIFHDIVDVYAESQKSNFKPFLVCLREGYIAKDYTDPLGYNNIHFGTSFNDVPLVYYILSEIKIDVDMRSSQSLQTPLMIASNFGLIELIRLLLEYKASLTLTDNCGFTPMLYAAKQNHIPAFIYLLHKGSDPRTVDFNGCTLAHWAAFKNSAFLLRLCKKLGIPLTTTDSKGYTPFQRGFSNDAYDAIKFFLEDKELNVLPEKINVEEIKSDSIRRMVQEKLDEKHNKFDINRRFWEFWMKHPRRNAFGSYLLVILLGFWGFLNGVLYRPENDFYIVNILFLVLGFYFMIYVYFFIFKLVFHKGKIPENNDYFEENDAFARRIKALKTKDAVEMNLMDFTHLNNLLSQAMNQSSTSVSIIYDDHSEMIKTPPPNWSFLHYISYLVDRYRFIDALDIDTNRLCPTCLDFKLPKTKHCKYCGVCVPYFNHHSHIFDRCVDYKNHPFYLVLLTLQQIILVLYVFLQISIYSSARTSYTLLAFFETGYLLLKNDGFMIFFVFIIMAILLFYNTVFWWIETYGVLTNQTYNEIFHRTRYYYLYGNWNDAKGRTWKVFTNATSQGVSKNVVRYLRRCLA